MFCRYVTINCSSLNCSKKFVLPSISLLDKIIEGNIDVVKTVNLLYQNGSLLKDRMLIFDMFLQLSV